MSPQTLTRGRRVLTGTTVAALTAGVLAFTPTAAQAADELDAVDGGSISWGLKSSFRGYLTGPIANGTITPVAPATDSGTQTVFAEAKGTWSDTEASVGAKGAVRYYGHAGELDLTISDPRIVVNGSNAELVVDAVDSEAQAHTAVPFADIDLSTAVSENALGVTITDAPTTITAEGSALLSRDGSAFYPAGTALDPVDAQFSVAATPTVTVSKVQFAPDESATVTVNGSGFDPQDVIAARPPLAGKPAGTYIAFGKYEKIWKPTDPAAPGGATRKNADVKWAVLEADMNTIGGTAGGAIELRPDGTFTAELNVSKAAADAMAGLTENHVQYGIYTYPGGGAKSAAWETYTPISFVSPQPSVTGLTTRYGKGGTVRVKAPVAGQVSVAGLGTKNAAAGATVAFTVSKRLTAGTRNLTVSLVPTDADIAAPAATTVRVSIAKTAAAKPRLSVKKKPTTRKKGKAVVRVAGVKGASVPTGKVRIKLTKGKKSKYVTTALRGQRTVTLPKLAKGKWTVRVAYYGNANYKPRGYAKVGTVKVTKK